MHKKELDKWERDKEFDFFFLKQAKNIARVNAKGNAIDILPQEQREIDRAQNIRNALSE